MREPVHLKLLCRPGAALLPALPFFFTTGAGFSPYGAGLCSDRGMALYVNLLALAQNQRTQIRKTGWPRSGEAIIREIPVSHGFKAFSRLAVCIWGRAQKGRVAQKAHDPQYTCTSTYHVSRAKLSVCECVCVCFYMYMWENVSSMQLVSGVLTCLICDLHTRPVCGILAFPPPAPTLVYILLHEHSKKPSFEYMRPLALRPRIQNVSQRPFLQSDFESI